MVATKQRFAFVVSLSFTLAAARFGSAQPMLINPASLTQPAESGGPAPVPATTMWLLAVHQSFS